MASIVGIVHFLVFITWCSGGFTQGSETPVSIEAALSIGHGAFLLISHAKYLSISNGKQQGGVNGIDDFFKLPSDFQIQAAYNLGCSLKFMRLFGSHFYMDVDLYSDTVTAVPYKDDTFPFNGGPDAVASFDVEGYPLVHFFKGCYLYLMMPFYGDQQISTESFIPYPLMVGNMPCGVQAAWSDGDKLVILKGDNIWWMTPDDDTFDGPHDFYDVYDVDKAKWPLKPL